MFTEKEQKSGDFFIAANKIHRFYGIFKLGALVRFRIYNLELSFRIFDKNSTLTYHLFTNEVTECNSQVVQS